MQSLLIWKLILGIYIIKFLEINIYLRNNELENGKDSLNS
jgi:hypothetical protein